jgi:hypothetical protein
LSRLSRTPKFPCQGGLCSSPRTGHTVAVKQAAR